MSVGQNMKKVLGIVPTNTEQIEVMQLEGCNRPTCNKLGLSASIRSVVSIELRLMTDGHRRTQGHNIHRASMAWRGKSPCVRKLQQIFVWMLPHGRCSILLWQSDTFCRLLPVLWMSSRYGSNQFKLGYLSTAKLPLVGDVQRVVLEPGTKSAVPIAFSFVVACYIDINK